MDLGELYHFYHTVGEEFGNDQQSGKVGSFPAPLHNATTTRNQSPKEQPRHRTVHLQSSFDLKSYNALKLTLLLLLIAMTTTIGCLVFILQEKGRMYENGRALKEKLFAVRLSSQNTTEDIKNHLKAYQMDLEEKIAAMKVAMTLEQSMSILKALGKESGWHIARNERLYKHFQFKVNHTVAATKCENVKAKLANEGIRNENVRSELVSGLLQPAKFNRIWIGLDDLKHEGTFMWSDGIAFSEGNVEWSTGNPDNSGGVEDCVEFSGLYNWTINDITCNQKFYFICEAH